MGVGMSEEKKQDQPLAALTQSATPDFMKLWLENPWTQAWVSWNKMLWASHPASRLIPLDVEEIWRALMLVGENLAAQPTLLQERAVELLRSYNELALATLRRSLGEAAGSSTLDKQDRRFQDKAWVNNLVFDTIRQSYLITATWLMTTARQMQGADARSLQRANFYIRQFVDMLSPTNFPLTNPEVLRETLETGGENLRRGLANLLDDLQRGEITVAGRQHFKVGVNLALTPGQVIFRNDLHELIQYAPATEQVHGVPILIIPPWINRYYVMDMRPGRSMVEYLVQQGFSVFLISWRNPDASMEHLNMEDYLKLGPLDALKVIKAITGSPTANLVGYCLGGTLLSIVLAYLEAIQDDSAHSGTFFTALQDFAEIGETAIFISEEWVSEIEKRTASKGYTDAIEMGSIFRLLRSNDLIWNFVVNNYLLGKEPLAFDLMYWSVDGTRMPRTCHLYYLRNMYLENNLIKPSHMTMLGQGIDLSRVRCPCYVVAGTEDHIVPWRSAHRARALFSGPVRRVLSHGGHITSIINAPPGKGSFFTNESDIVDPDPWLKSARRNEGSWWTDWVKWLGELSGDKCAPPTMGNADYTPLSKAPGTYVLQE